jgi:hypothetical protein
LVKEAYKGPGLTIGKQDNEYFLTGYYWVMRIREDVLTNKAKASLIELIGNMPVNGEVFQVRKGAPNQYEIPENKYWDIRTDFNQATHEFVKTNIIVEQKIVSSRVYQCEKSQEAVLLNEIFTDLVNPGLIDREKELEPEGPKALTENPTMLLWANGACCLAACIRTCDEDNYEEDFMKLLVNIDLSKK